MHTTFLFLLSAAAVQGWQLAFYLGPSCTSEELDNVDYPNGSGCDAINSAESQAQSIVVNMNDPNDSQYQVAFYGNTDCSGSPIDTVTSSVCYPDEDGDVKAYRVEKVANKRGVNVIRRSPQTIQSDIDTLFEGVDHALLQRDVDLAPPKHYDIAVRNNATHSDLEQYHTFISASIFTVTTALSFSSLVTGCVGVGSANAIASYSCASSLAATAISFMAALYHAYKGIRDIRATLHNNNVSIGLRHVKRGLASEITMTHEEYMEWILHSIGLNGTQLGHHQRYEHIDTKTPVYHFAGEDDQHYIFTISADADGEVRHSISFAHDAKVEKRSPGYQGVKVLGGLDIDGCQRAAGTYSDLPTSAKSAYSYYYQDFQCLVSSSELLNGNYVQSDIMDKFGNVVLTVGMSTWRGSQKDEVMQRAECSNQAFYFDQTCVY